MSKERGTLQIINDYKIYFSAYDIHGVSKYWTQL